MSDSATPHQMMLIIICVVFYFAPTFNACSRKHPARASIFLLNLFLGWTLLGWVIALSWSASPKKQEVVIDTADGNSGQPDKYAQLERLAHLKEKGVITEEEFTAEKSKLLNS